MLIGILLTFQILVCVALIGVILLQRSEGGALGMGGGGGGGFMTARGAGNLLTRTTGILAAIFFALSIGLTILGNFQRNASITNKVTAIDVNQVTQTASTPSAPSSAPKTPSLSDLGQPVLTPTPGSEAKKARAPTQSAPTPSVPSLLPQLSPTPSSTPASSEPASK